jgi:hypothetical protein
MAFGLPAVLAVRFVRMHTVRDYFLIPDNMFYDLLALLTEKEETAIYKQCAVLQQRVRDLEDQLVVRTVSEARQTKGQVRNESGGADRHQDSDGTTVHHSDPAYR